MATNVKSTHYGFIEDFPLLKEELTREKFVCCDDNFSEDVDFMKSDYINDKTSVVLHETENHKDHGEYSKAGVVLIAENCYSDATDILINVTTSDQISKSHFSNDEMWFIPHVVTPIRKEPGKDYLHHLKASMTVIVLDLIVNPSCLKQVHQCASLCNIFINFVTSVIKKYIDVKKLNILGFDIYIGKSVMVAGEILILDHSVRTLSSIEVVGSIAVKSEGHNEIINMENNHNIKKSIEYKIKYLNSENIEVENILDSHTNMPSLISLELFLPVIDSIEDIDLETDANQIKLKTKYNFALDLKMDYPVLKDPVKSTFFKDKNILYLELKINETGCRKINLSKTNIELIKEDCLSQDHLDPVQLDSEETQFILPDYKITQSMTDYALTVNTSGMVKGSLKHIYIGNDALEVTFDKYVTSCSPIKCRLIFDVSPKKINCGSSFLNQAKRSLTFTIKKVIPKIFIKAKIGSFYESLEEIKVLYFERKYSKKKGKQSEWIKECPERTRSLSESSAFYPVNEGSNGTSRQKQNSICNGSQSNRKRDEYFLTSSWPKGILKRSNSEYAYDETADDNIFDEYESTRGKLQRKQSLGSSSSIYTTSSTDSISYMSGIESSLEDLSINSSSPQKKVLFSGVILKEVYKAGSSIVGTKNKREYLRKHKMLSKRAKKGNIEAQEELKKLDKAFKNSRSVVDDECIDFELYNKVNMKQSKKRKRKKDSLQHLDKEELIFSLDDD